MTRSARRFGLTTAFLLALTIGGGRVSAKMRVPSIDGKLPELNDLPTPDALRASVIGKEATLVWNWQLPEQHPNFSSLGFEVERQDGKRWAVPTTTFSDFNLAFGTYTYRVRVLGEAKERGQRLMHVSEWSEAAQAVVNVACSGAPSIQLTVQAAPRAYASQPVKLRLVGAATVPEGCHLGKTTYRVQLADGSHRSEPLPVDARGRFDATIEPANPDDQSAPENLSYTVTATAEDEAGPTTSDAYTLNLQMRNPYAPRNSDD